MSRPEIPGNPEKPAFSTRDGKGRPGAILCSPRSIPEGCLWYVYGRSIAGLGEPRDEPRKTLGEARVDLRDSPGFPYDLSEEHLQSQVLSGNGRIACHRRKRNENKKQRSSAPCKRNAR